MSRERAISIAFTIISGVIVLAHVFSGTNDGTIVYAILLACSAFSILIKPQHATAIQILLCVLTGVYVSIFYDEFCGYAIIFIGLILSICKYPAQITLLLVVSFCIIYIVSIIEVKQTKSKIFHAAIDASFFTIYAYVVWLILKNQIENIVEREKDKKERYMRIIDEATSVARDAIALCEKEKETLNNRKE